MGREKGKVMAMLVKLGAALAISFAGLTYTRFRLRKVKLHNTRSSSSSVKDVDNHGEDLDGGRRNESTWIRKHGSIHSNPEGVIPAETSANFGNADKYGDEDEVLQLRDMVKVLTERERSLEMQLLEYYGLQEQQNSVMELQNRVKINNTESRLFGLKIETLHADNRRLQEELEASRIEIRFLKRKLKTEAEQSKEEILKLREKVEKFHQQNRICASGSLDVNELRKCKFRLEVENSELKAKIVANEVPEIKEANHRLKEENQNLSTEIEQLQADRCADVEEVVYLRWLNACLRYELRNYQAPEGKTTARDLRVTSSPNSEEKAKQLILKYANIDELGGDFQDLDFDYRPSSSSKASYLEDSGEFDESNSILINLSSTTRRNTSNKLKFFNKIKKLIPKRDRNPPIQACTTDKLSVAEVQTRTCSSASPSCSTVTTAALDDCRNRMASPSRPSRFSLDLQKPKVLCVEDEDLEILRNCERLLVEKKNFCYYDPKSDIAKYAKALMNNRAKKTKSHRRSFSCY